MFCGFAIEEYRFFSYKLQLDGLREPSTGRLGEVIAHSPLEFQGLHGKICRGLNCSFNIGSKHTNKKSPGIQMLKISVTLLLWFTIPTLSHAIYYNTFLNCLGQRLVLKGYFFIAPAAG